MLHDLQEAACNRICETEDEELPRIQIHFPLQQHLGSPRRTAWIYLDSVMSIMFKILTMWWAFWKPRQDPQNDLPWKASVGGLPKTSSQQPFCITFKSEILTVAGSHGNQQPYWSLGPGGTNPIAKWSKPRRRTLGTGGADRIATWSKPRWRVCLAPSPSSSRHCTTRTPGAWGGTWAGRGRKGFKGWLHGPPAVIKEAGSMCVCVCVRKWRHLCASDVAFRDSIVTFSFWFSDVSRYVG